MNSEWYSRIVSGIPLTIGSIGLILISHETYGNFFFLLCAILLSWQSLYEFGELSRNKGAFPFSISFFTFTPVFLVLTYFEAIGKILLPVTPCAVFLFLIFLFLIALKKSSTPFLDLSSAFFALFYILIPLSLGLRITYGFSESDEMDGRWWLLFVLGATKTSDMGGYFFGKAWGKNRLAPVVSPNKTWEGALGGLFSTLIFAFVYQLLMIYLFPKMIFSFKEALFLGALFSLLGQLGDLSESLLKRDCKVKDSSKLLHHGGILDLVDSLLFTLPFLFFYLSLLSKGT